MDSSEVKTREELVKFCEKEIKQLKAELVAIAKEIKDVKDSDTRKALFEDKKQIEEDLLEAKSNLAIFKGEDETLPVEDLEKALSGEVDTNADDTKKEIENEL